LEKEVAGSPSARVFV